MLRTIDLVFAELFPARAKESLDDFSKLTEILDKGKLYLVREDTLLEALCEGMELQIQAELPVSVIAYTKGRIEEILEVPIDLDNTATILSLLREGKHVSDIAAWKRAA
jgi:hypothetical protein